MTWLLDLGNTRLKWAELVDGELRPGDPIAHREPDFDRRLDHALQARARPDRALLASVAGPDVTARVVAILSRAGVACEHARSHAALGPVRIAYAEPTRFGVDRFLSLLGAHRRGAGPWLVVGIGTALTIDALTAEGRHLGGLIAPSPALMREALAARAGQLDCDGGERRDFATDTADALASGCEGSALALIERARLAAAARIGAAPQVLVSGGGAAALAAELQPGATLAPDLVLEGLAAYAAH